MYEETEAEPVNTLILAYPYVDGSQGSHTSTGSGYFIGGTASYPMSGGPSAVNGTTTGNGFYSGTSFGSSTVRNNVKQPLSELRIGGYLLGFNDPFTAYKTTLGLRSIPIPTWRRPRRPSGSGTQGLL